MSLLDAQEWLDRRRDNNQPLYAVMVQLDGDGEYQLIWVDIGELEATDQIEFAEWSNRDCAEGLAKLSIGDLCRFKGEDREIVRAFIVEKGEDCRVIEEVKDDAA